MKGLGWAKCPGTCGEWIQGAQKGTPFLIGCPINRFVEAQVELSFKDLQQDFQDWLWLLPPGKEKIRQALERLARRQKLPPFTARIHIESQLQIGRGMASSTADMAAAVVALAYAWGISWEPEELGRLLLEIEPTDPIMFQGVTEFAHRDGSYVKQLTRSKIPAKLLMLDWGGILDTQAFNARGDLPGHYRKNERRIKKALSLFYEGIEQSDLEKIAGASTISARCNQEINPKPLFEEFLSWTVAQGGLGLLTAHSGTLLAGIFPAHLSQADQKTILREAQGLFHPDQVEWLETYDEGIKGGVKIARREFIGGQGTLWETNLY